jgi:hypothetical protein
VNRRSFFVAHVRSVDETHDMGKEPFVERYVVPQILLPTRQHTLDHRDHNMSVMVGTSVVTLLTRIYRDTTDIFLYPTLALIFQVRQFDSDWAAVAWRAVLCVKSASFHFFADLAHTAEHIPSQRLMVYHEGHWVRASQLGLPAILSSKGVANWINNYKPHIG